MVSTALFEGFYENEYETREWLKALENKVDNEEKPPLPKKRKSNMPPIDEDQVTRMDIQAIRRDLDYIIPGLFLEVRKLRGDGNQYNRFSSFDYTGSQLNDYAGSHLKMMIENDDGDYFSCFKHLKAHVMPMASGLNLQVAEMRDHVQDYDRSIFSAHGKLSRLEKLIASIQDDLQRMKKDINDINMKDGYEHCHNEKEIHGMARKLKLDANFTTEEEIEANHTMVLCDLTDCEYCIERTQKNCDCFFLDFYYTAVVVTRILLI